MSSILSTNVPFWDFATRYSYSAVLRFPTCMKPVGLGAKRVRTIKTTSLVFRCVAIHATGMKEYYTII